MALGSWALGRPAMLWADTILPWSSPVPASEAPANWPGWYELNAENPEYFVQGELQRQLMAWGWERNMLEPRNESTGVTTGQKNFPATSGFNMVLVATNALKQSTDAPPRVRAGVERTAELTTWPFTRETGVTDFTQLYMEQFVREGAPTTYAMFQIAEREIRQMFDPTPPGTGEDGIAAIRAQVEFCLNETSGWPDQTLGWYLVDEPELPGKVSPRNIQYLSFNRLLIVRSVIRDAEYDYRVANEPGFANLTIAERVARLRPIVLSLSDHAFHKTANGRLMYRFHGVADLIMYDFYPYRMTTQQVAADYSDIPEVLEGQEEQWEEKVTFSLSRFAEMRRVFNFDACGNGIPVGGVAYKPMINWVQAKGAMDTPIRMHGDRMALWVPPDADLRPEPRWEAAPPPIRTVTEDNRVRINPPRLRRMPSEDRLRFYSWASVFLGSEGLAFHSLPEAPSALLYEESELSDARYAKVAQEILYFADLREDIFGNREGVDETDLLNLDYGDGPGGPLPGEFVRPQVVLYVYNRPTGAERWLFIVNPTDRIIGASMIPDRSLTRLGTETEDHVFAEYKFGDEVSPRRTITAGIPHLAVLFPHSFRLYKRVPL